MSKIILIGCGKQKARARSIARELYTGSMFSARLRHAEQSGCPWWIVSAKHGLVLPDELLNPYDLTISDLSVLDKSAWPLNVVASLIDHLPESIQDARQLRAVLVELHLGADYAEPLIAVIQATGMSHSWPMRGLSQGEQMKTYGQNSRAA